MVVLSTLFIDYLERNLLDDQDIFIGKSIEWKSLLKHKKSKNLCFHQICGIPAFASSNNFEQFSSTEATYIGDLLSGIHGIEHPLVYVIASFSNYVQLFIGTYELTYNSKNTILPSLLNSVYPGIELDSTDNLQTKLSDIFETLPHTAIVTGTPTLKTKPNQFLAHQIDRFIRLLYGTEWAYVVVAEPIRWQDIQKFSEHTLNEIRLVVNAEQGANAKSPIGEKYKQKLNRLWSKLQSGKSQGMWNTIGYLLTSQAETLSCAKGAAKSIFGGKLSSPDPLRVIDLPGVNQRVANFSLPISKFIEPPGQIHYSYDYLSFLNSSELAAMIHLPSQEVPGYFVRPQAKFDVTPHKNTDSNKNIKIGEVLNQGRHMGTDYLISLDSLTKHTMVVGTTGGGKTNTVFHLLRQAIASGIPFLVIEPAKTEYRTLLESEMGNYLQVFTLGNETLSPFRLNPFEVLPGVSVQTHIDHLKSVFNASFVMYAPMPYVLEQCIHEIYEDKGWDLVSDDNNRGVHPRAYPTLSDLYYKVDEVVERLGYENDITMNIRAALKTRINSLRVGGKGLMLDNHKSLPISKLLQVPTILELDHVGDDDEKSFLIGLVLMSLYEHYRSTGHSEDGRLKHITVIEEAHRLLKKAPPVSDIEASNMAGKAVESFCNILAEIRAYGEGILVAEQIPSKLTPDVIKNTNLKIVHRTVAEEDRRLVGGCMNLEASQMRWLSSCPVGEAAVFGDEDDNPIRIKVPYRKIDKATTIQSSNQKVSEAMVTFKAQNSEYFNMYPWSSLDYGILQKHYIQARRIIDNREFQEAFTRYVLSSVLISQSIINEFPRLIQIINKKAIKPDTDGLLETIFIYAIDWLFETRGRQIGVSYTDIEEIKQQFTSILFVEVLSKQKNTEMVDSGYLFEQPELISTFQAEFKRIFECNTYPFAGCDRVCANNACLYRDHVASLVNDGHLYRKFEDTLANSPHPELWENIAKISIIAANRLISAEAPGEEKRKTSLCFAIQAGEAVPTLDSWLRETLLTGLLPLFDNEEFGEG